MAIMEQIHIWKAQSVTFSVTCQNQSGEQSETIKHTCILKSQNYSFNKQVSILATTMRIPSNTSRDAGKYQSYTYL